MATRIIFHFIIVVRGSHVQSGSGALCRLLNVSFFAVIYFELEGQLSFFSFEGKGVYMN